MKKYYSDYPNEPSGDKNPYYRCSYCKVTDPEINGEIKNHRSNCIYRKLKEAELANMPETNNGLPPLSKEIKDRIISIFMDEYTEDYANIKELLEEILDRVHQHRYICSGSNSECFKDYYDCDFSNPHFKFEKEDEYFKLTNAHGCKKCPNKQVKLIQYKE